MNGLHDSTVLRLNANYMRIGWSSPAEAFGMLMGESKDGSPPALALDVHYNYDEFGKPITDKMVNFDRLDWDYWMIIDPRKGDLDRVIHTSKRIIRIPSVILCPHFAMMPMKDLKPTPKAIKQRDNNKCQYTGVELTRATFSLDHVVPKSKGGKDSWENLVAAHKDFNSRKGDKFNHEIGAMLKKQPRAPKSIPLCNLVVGNFHPDHFHFDQQRS
jgi:5-methylcytosine-specific restriction endonuclease McrA